MRNLLLNCWIVFHSGTSEHLRDVAYGNSLWVAVGANGTILTSPNGTSWTSRTSGTSEHLWGVAYADGIWVATVRDPFGNVLGLIQNLHFDPRAV